MSATQQEEAMSEARKKELMENAAAAMIEDYQRQGRSVAELVVDLRCLQAAGYRTLADLIEGKPSAP